MDATDILSTTLNNLQIFQPSTSQDFNQPPSQTTTSSFPTTHQTFPLYPTLPSELRLKILTHTLPPPRSSSSTSLHLNAVHILLSDPSFGLYLTFSISCAVYIHSLGAFHPVPKPGEITAGLKTSRMLTLLSTTKETRAFYLSRYPIEFPSGPNGKARIRVSKQEILYFDNFPSLLAHPDFSSAIRDNYRLQDYWTQIENLAIPVMAFVDSRHGNYAVLLEAVRKCTGLKTLGAVMWDGFRDGERERAEGAVRSVLVGVEGYLEEFRGRLKEGVEDGEGCGRMPVVKILEG
ncbi:hypothetical protein ONS96_013425 [Cadophora gregata f. sp. sojae]|nr:hypothetical protein ONS96_013425 [Cadophora gregata f. sp. sojae]